jgi:hypothetical protein
MSSIERNWQDFGKVEVERRRRRRRRKVTWLKCCRMI